MLDGLDAVDWAALGAEAAPNLIRALAEGSGTADAWYELDELLCDSTPAASAAALPFLVQVAADPHGSVRGLLLESLPELWEYACDGPGSVPAEWERAWSRQIPGLLALLDDPEPRVRQLVLLALSYTIASPDRDRIVAGLREYRDREADVPTRIDAALVLGQLAGAGSDGPSRVWLTDQLDHDDPETRLAAAAALVKLDPDHDAAQEVMAAAVRRGDVPPWHRRSWHNYPKSAADWAAGCVDRLRGQQELWLEQLDNPDEDRRGHAASQLALMLATWRSTERTLLPVLGSRLDEFTGETRSYALHVMAACGTASARYADQLAALVDDDTPASRYADESHGDLATWALARIGDKRCVPVLQAQIRGSRTGFDPWSSAGGYLTSYLLDMPAMRQVLGPLREGIASALLPAVRHRLKKSKDYQWHRDMSQTLQEWGPKGAAAVPELIRVLTMDAAGWAAMALGEIGPAAADGARALSHVAGRPRPEGRRFVRSRRSRHVGRLYLPNPDSQPRVDATVRMQAAWAYARVTGDVEFAVDVLSEAADSDCPRPAIRLLAMLGPLPGSGPAHRKCVDWVLDVARDGDEWDRIDAAQVHWRLTGDPEIAVGRMVESLRPLERAWFEPQMALAVRYAGDLGPLATATAPALRALLDLDVRLSRTGGWQAIDDDQRIRVSAEAALTRVTGTA